ncbi:MAG: Rieske 2Fe-2S domain-containing protein [Candidatus Levybacteria bacterium]|nr:Rieske 2Fe-2S domain-containing protein [Candidatus Levybacteria bacterium]
MNNLDDLKNGEGKVIEINGEQAAVSKDDNGNITAVSAVCTHMECIVEWNKNQKTWDCPCHGSKFSKDGKVLQGPAQKDLPKVEI